MVHLQVMVVQGRVNRWNWRHVLMIATLGVGPLACASNHDQMQEKLYYANDAYFRHLRWQDFDRAVEYLPAESAEEFLTQCEKWRENLVIVDAELTRLKLEKQLGVAKARREIQWHRPATTVVKRTVVDQTWQWYEGQWYLVQEERVSGTPLALVGDDAQGSVDLVADASQAGASSSASDSADGATTAYLPGLTAFREQRHIGETPPDDRKGRRKRRE